MRKLILAAVLATAGCTTPATQRPSAAAQSMPDGYDLAAQRAKIARIRMNPDTSFLNAEERQVINYLVEAAELMTQIYLRQAFADNPRLRAEIAASNHPRKAQLLDMFDLHFGVWDSLDEYRPFHGSQKLPNGAGFYRST